MQEDVVGDYPAVVVDISTSNRSPVTATAQYFDAVVNFVVYANRDPGNLGIASPDNTIIRASLDAVIARMLVVFDNIVLAALTDTDDASRKWFFSKSWRQHLGAVQSTSLRVRQPITYRLNLSKGTA